LYSITWGVPVPCNHSDVGSKGMDELVPAGRELAPESSNWTD